MPFSHIVNLRERRAAYANALQALYAGTLSPEDRARFEGVEEDLRTKLAALDLLLDGKPADFNPD